MRHNQLVDFASACGRRRTSAPLRGDSAGHHQRYTYSEVGNLDDTKSGSSSTVDQEI